MGQSGCLGQLFASDVSIFSWDLALYVRVSSTPAFPVQQLTMMSSRIFQFPSLYLVPALGAGTGLTLTAEQSQPCSRPMY